MTSWLLNLVYAAAYALFLPVIVWRRIARGRSLGNPAQRIFGCVPVVRTEHPVVWIHAVSVGEVNQLETVIDTWSRRHPDHRLVLSTTTATGMEQARNKYPNLTLFWFPIDFSWAIRTAMRRIQPALLVLTELELWPNLISIADRQNIPVAVINGRLGEKSFHGYQRFLSLTRPVFSKLALVATQDESNAHRFSQSGVSPDRVHVVGSLKFDNAARPPDRNRLSDHASQLRQQYALVEGTWLWVAGSTHHPEEAMVARAYRSLLEFHTRLRLAIVPRHPHRSDEIARTLVDQGLSVVRRSSGESIQPLATGHACPPVVLVDTIGELDLWWSLADGAFVGGSFCSRGGQNMLEPGAAGCATCFGPNTRNFAEIAERMVASQAAVRVADSTALSGFVKNCLDQPDYASNLGRAAIGFVEKHRGATSQTVSLLTGLLVRTTADKQVESRAA